MQVNFNMPLKKIKVHQNKISELVFQGKKKTINSDDKIIFALSLSGFQKIFPTANLPESFNSILNIHFKVSQEIIRLFKHQIIGMVNSTSQWVFVKKNHISVTVSNANKFNNLPQDEIARIIWKEVCMYLNSKILIKEYRVVNEKKATFVQSPKNFVLIKKLHNLPENLILAGDWTQYNLPCTIESSILSGKKAIELLRF